MTMKIRSFLRLILKIDFKILFSFFAKLKFKALVTPCLSSCEPAKCDVRTHDNMIRTLDSYGRRRKRSIDALGSSSSSLANNNNNDAEELIVMQTIKIMDSFNSNSTKRRANKLENLESWEWSTETECTSLITMIIICSLFLFGQLLIICIFIFIWNRKHSKSQFKRQLLNSDLHSLSNFTTTSNYSLDYSTGSTLPRAQLIYPFNSKSSNLRSNQVPNFIVNKNVSKFNTSLYNQEPAYNSNLFN